MTHDSHFKALQSARSQIPACDPPRFLRGPHLQTIAGHCFTSGPVISGTDVEVDLDTKDEQIVSEYFPGTRKAVAHLFHGLGGDTESGYMRRIGRVALGLGYHVYLNNHRGCGTGTGRARAPYHAGRAEDLSAVLEASRARFPKHLHVAIGFSLSANALLLLAAGARGNTKPDVAIAVNGPIDLENTSLRLGLRSNRVYDRHFVLTLQNYLKANGRTLKKVRTLREFDEEFTAREAGFQNRAEYYRLCSSKPHLPKINIPTVLLTAEDDPFVPIQDYRTSQLSSMTLLHIERFGGHLGYVSRGPSRWLDHALGVYMNALVSTTAHPDI